jgi:hypothetical protein
VVTAVATVLGLAAPANAAYNTQAIALPWNPAGAVHASLAGNGVVYLGGKLDGTGGIAAVDPATGNLLWMVPANKDVRALALSADGSTLYAGGTFSTVDGATHRHLVAIDVASHTVVAKWKAGAAGEVRDLLVHGNDLYVAGKITSVAGVTQRGLGAVNAATGKYDPAFAFSADNDVLGMTMAGNLLLISGAFTHVNGAPRSELASIDLATNTLTSWAPAKLCTSCDQYWDVVTDGTNAYVGTSGLQGFLGAYNLTTGRQPWQIVSADGDVQALSLDSDGRLYYGGHFAHWTQSGYASFNPRNPTAVTNVAALFTATGQIDGSFNPRIYKPYPGVWTITITGGKLWVGGDFGGEGVPNSKGVVVNNKKPFLAAYNGI